MQMLSGLVSKLMESQRTLLELMQRTEEITSPSLSTASTLAVSISTLNSEHTKISRGSQTIRKLRYSTHLSLSGYLNRRSFTSFSSKKCAFDSDLEVSGVYKSSADQGNDRSGSLRSATSQLNRPSSAQLSLADITNPSFLSLPLFASEISNSQWYDFGRGGLVLGWRKWGIISSCLPCLKIKCKENTTTVSTFEKVNRC
jgi:hypothetical protein